MVSKFQIVITIAISIIFFIFGFTISNYLNVKSPNSEYTQLGSILGGIGAGSSMINLIRSWLIEDKKTAKLDFDEVIQNNVQDLYLLRLGKQYFLRIKNEKPDPLAKSTRGFITIEGTNVDYKPLIWENNRKEFFDIGYQDDLFLFSIEETQTGYNFNIPYIPPEEKKKQNLTEFFNPNVTFEDLKSKKVLVRIDSNSASTSKKPYSSFLKEVLDNAKVIQ